MSESVGPVTLTSTQPDFEFRSMVGTEELSQLFRYDLELLNPSAKVPVDKMLGSPMTVHLVQKNGKPRHFSGVVTDFSLRGGVGVNALYAVTLRPWLYLLSQRINCRIFKGTAVQIVKTVFEDYGGLPVVTEGATEASTEYEFVVQYRESDLNFVMRILERDGIYFYFKHEADRHSLVLTDSERLTVEGYTKMTYHPLDGHSQEQGEFIDDWRSHHVFTTGRFTTTDFNFEAPGAPLEARANVPPAQLIQDLEAYDFPGGYREIGEGEKIASRRLEALQVPATRFEGRGNVRGVTAGQLFTLEKHTTTAFNMDYVVYSVQFQILSHAQESGGLAGGGDVMAASIVALDAAKPYRPVPRTPKPNMTGVQTAIVVGPESGEIHTDPNGYGMVKVRFHWDRDPDRTGKNSCWVRVSQAWAGPSMGVLFHPRIGQEVIVDFIEGDPDRPLIIGRVHNFDNMPPYALTDPNSSQSGIKTRSTPDGTLQNFNEIRFEDKKGAEELFIQAEKTQTTKVKGSQSISVGGSRSLSVGGNDSTTVGKNRETTVTGSDTIKVTGIRKITVHEDVEENYFKKHTILVGDAQAMQAKTQEFNASGGIQLIQAPETKQTLKDGAINLAAQTKIELACTSTKIFMDTAFLNLEATTKVQLQVGGTLIEIEGSSIKITSSGVVSVTGTQIKLNS
jgi:type VI secretion system secreted protein VgrG